MSAPQKPLPCSCPKGTKKISVQRQCERSLKALQGIFEASRYVGPRPDHALGAFLRATRARYVTAMPEVNYEIETSLLVCASIGRISGAVDREHCWLLCDEERKKLSKVLMALYRKRPDESVHEWMESANSFRKSTTDETTLAVISTELEALSEALPLGLKKDRR